MTTEEIHQLVLYPKKSSSIWLLLCSCIMVACGLLMARSEGLIGYLCASFFALGIPIAIVELLPSSTYLEIDKDGLSYVNLFRVTKLSWNDINEFFVVSMKQTGVTIHKMVAFNYAAIYDRSQIGRRLNHAIAGCENALPNTYGKTAEELAELLNRSLAQFHNRDRKPREQVTERLAEGSEQGTAPK